MKKRVHIFGALLLLAAGPSLAEKYSRFLDQEATYLITEREREIFLKLTSDSERDKFIENFWSMRDPIPETLANEFKEEHYRRIQESNRRYSEAREGWRTDRGRMYIVLGPPQDVMRYPSQQEIYPLEIWYYYNLDFPNFPTAVRFMFFRRKGVGEYRLFSPAFDGMRELLADPVAKGLLGRLGQIPFTFKRYFDTEILEAAESVSPGHSPQASEELIARVQTPGFAFDRFARKLEGRVTADVAFGRELPVGYRADYFRGEGGFSEVHLVLEIAPEELRFNQYDDRFQGRIDLFGSVRNPAGELVDQFQDTAELGVDLAAWEQARHYPFLYQRKLSLLPGRYQTELLVRDFVGRRVASIERALSVPSFPSDRMSISSFFAAFKADQVAPERRPDAPPHSFGDLKLFPRAAGPFGRGQRLLAFLELYYPPGQVDSARLEIRARFVLRREEEIVLDENSRFRPRADREGTVEILKILPGPVLVPGNHSLEVHLEDNLAGFSDLARVDFKVDAPQELGRLSAVGREELAPAERFLRQGHQHFLAGDYAQASARFQAALDYDPRLQPARIGKARSQIYAGDPASGERSAREALAAEPGSYDATVVLGLAQFRQGRFAEAASTYRQALKLGGESVELLNALGEAQLQAGETEAAREAFSRSLALNPNQEQVRKILEQIKGQGQEVPKD